MILELSTRQVKMLSKACLELEVTMLEMGKVTKKERPYSPDEVRSLGGMLRVKGTRVAIISPTP